MKRTDKIKGFKQPNRHVKRKRRAVKARKSVEIREISNENLNVSSDFNYVIYLSIHRDYYQQIADTKAIKDFSQHGFSGKWQFKYMPTSYGRTEKRMTRIYLQEESDLVMLRLCHNIHIDRIHHIKH